jgi:NAD(P)-dependent dehydrogenase (short-subunit alcohol dehydrogenase family)
MPPARDLEGRQVVITGANIGIGLATATALAARGARLRLLGRSAAKTLPVLAELKAIAGHDAITFTPLALDRLASVRECAAAVLASDEPIHLLINNAGIGGARGQTADGFEQHWGVNHLGHYLLTELLLDRILESSSAAQPARVVNVASGSHFKARRIDWGTLTRPTGTMTGMKEYAVSKLANVIHMRELARRQPGLVCASLNPGRIASNIWQRMPPPFRQIFKATMWSTERGALSTLHCATAPGIESGGYYDKHSRLQAPNPLALDPPLVAEVEQRSRQWVGLA